MEETCKCDLRCLDKLKALVVLSADGFVEVYGERELGVKIVQRLYPGPTDDPFLEVMCDDYLIASLPEFWRRLYYASKLRATGQCERITAEREMERLADVACLKLIREAFPLPERKKPCRPKPQSAKP